MLETIREFGWDRLAASGETETVWQRHADYMVESAETAEPLLRGPDQLAWFERLETELPNLRAALTWHRESGNVAGGLRLAAALWTFWVVRDHVPEGRRWLEEFLAMEQDGSAERLRALIALGDLNERQGDYAAATAWTEEALALARTLGDRGAEAAALRGLGNVAMARGEVALHELGDPALHDAEFTLARSSLDQSLALARELGDEWAAAKASHWLGVAIGSLDDDAGAIAHIEMAIERFRRLGDLRQICIALWNFAGSTRGLGDLPRAREAFTESLALAQRLGYRWHGGLCLVELAGVAVESGAPEQAAWLLGAAEVLRKTAGSPMRPVVQTHHDEVMARAREVLGEADFVAAWNAGAALTPDEAIARALAGAAGTTVGLPMPPPSVAGDGLTSRELDVLRLLVDGQTDRKIADALFISRRTASKHVAAILAKLGASSRAEAAARAVRDGLA